MEIAAAPSKKENTIKIVHQIAGDTEKQTVNSWKLRIEEGILLLVGNDGKQELKVFAVRADGTAARSINATLNGLITDDNGRIMLDE